MLNIPKHTGLNLYQHVIKSGFNHKNIFFQTCMFGNFKTFQTYTKVREKKYQGNLKVLIKKNN